MVLSLFIIVFNWLFRAMTRRSLDPRPLHGGLDRAPARTHGWQRVGVAEMVPIRGGLRVIDNFPVVSCATLRGVGPESLETVRPFQVNFPAAGGVGLT